jgi:hypothetical protein
MRSEKKNTNLSLMAGAIGQAFMPLGRATLLLGAASTLAALFPGQLFAEASIGLYNPVHHGLIVSFSPNAEPLNEFSADRIGKAHELFRPKGVYVASPNLPFPGLQTSTFLPFYVRKEVSDFYQANPGAPPILDSIYRAWELANPQLPGRSSYQNVKIFPSEPEAKFGANDKWGYFDPMVTVSSSTAGSGLFGNGGRLTLTSPDVDTGFGNAVGEITPEGDIKLRVDIDRSGGPGFTPVAEAALEATLYDTFSINLAQSDAVSARLSVAAKASIPPILDFRRANLFSYAVGYQFAIYEEITFGETAYGQSLLNNADPFNSITPEQAALPAFREHWGASGLYWVDARQRDPGAVLGDEKFVTLESIGLPVPDMAGVTESQAPIEFSDFGELFPGLTGTPVAFKDIREFSYKDSDPLSSRFYDDPLMPFNEFKEVENVLLPTNTPLRLVLNFFVMAGASDSGNFGPSDFFIDGGNTAGFGITLDDPNAQLLSDAGFNYRPAAVPEPASLTLLIAGLGMVGSVARRRRSRPHGAYAAEAARA